MEQSWLIKIGEISLKGKNQRMFTDRLKKNIQNKLKHCNPNLSGKLGRFFLRLPQEANEEVISSLSTTPGIVSFAPVSICGKSLEEIVPTVLSTFNGTEKTYKIDSRRSDKGFPLTSYELSSFLGDEVRKAYSHLSVRLNNPDKIVYVEVRDRVLVYSKHYRGPGGLPAGTAGKGLLLLSGGIDSPVAGYAMAKRGLSLDAVYFHAYPYTSDEAKEKVLSLAHSIAPYASGMDLFIVPFTEVQLFLKKHIEERYITLLMRACMMKISRIISEKHGCLCLITGESLSQVASQTVQSLAFTGSVQDLPVFRPLIGLDKEEIISLARSIGTFETSVLPFEDCCVLFSPKHPEIRPKKVELTTMLAEIAIDPLLEKAAETAEVISIPASSSFRVPV